MPHAHAEKARIAKGYGRHSSHESSHGILGWARGSVTVSDGTCPGRTRADPPFGTSLGLAQGVTRVLPTGDMSSEPIFVEAAMPTFSRALHMALTVRDIRVSADWDERVLGFDFVKEFEADPGDAGIPRILLLHQHSGFLPGRCNLRAERAMPSIRCGRAGSRRL
jgi:hypothetical protein